MINLDTYIKRVCWINKTRNFWGNHEGWVYRILYFFNKNSFHIVQAYERITNLEKENKALLQKLDIAMGTTAWSNRDTVTNYVVLRKCKCGSPVEANDIGKLAD